MGNSLFPSRRFIIIDAVLVKLPRSFSRLKLTPISVGPIYPRSWRSYQLSQAFLHLLVLRLLVSVARAMRFYFAVEDFV